MMWTNKSFEKEWDETLLGEDFSGLNDIYREIADEIGIENTMVIYRMFHGTQISFPNRLFSKEFIHRAIRKEYDGTNAFRLALKYNYSERSIRRIVQSEKQIQED